MRIVILCHSYVTYYHLVGWRGGRIQRSDGRVLSAGTCRGCGAASGQLASSCSVTLVPVKGTLGERRLPALPKGSACVVWRYVFGSEAARLGCAVAMDHLNTSCCIHVGWEPRRVHGPSEKSDVALEAEAPPTSIDRIFEIKKMFTTRRRRFGSVDRVLMILQPSFITFPPFLWTFKRLSVLTIGRSLY